MNRRSFWNSGFSLAVVVLVAVGCKRQPGDDHAHGDAHAHGDEPRTAQLTIWGERHEIFTEHRFVVAGKETKFVTHVTDLQTLEPRREGLLTYRLQLGQETPLEQVEKAPSRAGIYEPMLTFPKEGWWKVAVKIPADGKEFIIEYPPVKVFASEHDAEHGEEQDAPEGISFLKEQQWKILSRAEPVTKRRLVERVRVSGTVVARPGSMAQVTTPIAGRLLLPAGKAMPLIGERVEARQLLALVQPAFSEIGVRLVEAEAEVNAARLAEDQAKQTYERIRKLAEAEAKPEREVREAEFTHKIAKARLETAIAVQATYRTATAGLVKAPGQPDQTAVELRAPIDGVVVGQLGSAIGEYITPDKPIFTLLNPETVFIEARVHEASVSKLTEARGALLEIGGEFRPLDAAQGARMVFSGLQVDSATRTVPLIYEMKNSDGKLRIGQAVALQLETSRSEDAIALPDSAIVEEAGQFIAFVQVSGETFEKRELKLGIREGGFVQVLDGVKEGERVVTKGAYAIRLASVSGVIPAHGHAH